MAKNNQDWGNIVGGSLGISYEGRDGKEVQPDTPATKTLSTEPKAEDNNTFHPEQEPLQIEPKPVTTPKQKIKKSNAGRKKIDEKKKKKQMVLTLSPETYNRLIEWAESKPRSAPNYVSEFVEEHIEDIIQ